jgi:hypothetical protein
LGGAEETIAWAFGALGQQDQAKYLATLYLADLADAVRDGIDPRFELSRYAEKLAVSAPTFDPLHAALQQPPTLVDRMLQELTARGHRAARARPGRAHHAVPGQRLRRVAHRPGHPAHPPRDAHRVGRRLSQHRTARAEGPARVRLRRLRLPRRGRDAPLLGLLGQENLNNTFTRENGAVVFHPPSPPSPAFAATGLPTYDGLPLDRYLSVFDMLNPMHRVWSDGRWNKLMVSYGCYWSQCTFCDTRLDYIERFSKAPAQLLVDRMEALIRETGQTGFHLVDEAAPPALLRALSDEILRRRLTVTWWGNIRFEKSFTRALCELDGGGRLRGRQRRAGGGGRPAAGPHPQGRHGGTGGARHPRLHGLRHHGACVPDVRLPHPDGAGDGELAGDGAAAVRGRLHPVRLLAPLRPDRAQPDCRRPGRLRHPPAAGAGGYVRPQRDSV